MGSYKSRLSLGTACLALALDSVVYHSIGVSSPFKATDFELPTQAIQIFLLPFVAAVIDGLIGGERTMIFGFVVTMSGIAFGALGWNFGILSIHQVRYLFNNLYSAFGYKFTVAKLSICQSTDLRCFSGRRIYFYQTHGCIAHFQQKP